MDVRLAVPTDIDSVMSLVASCIAAMREAGIEQWDDVYPSRGTMSADIESESLHVASLPGQPTAAVIALNEYQNPEYDAVPWTISGVPVLVVHRLMVNPTVQRNGLARSMMLFAEERAAAGGYGAIRLDAFTLNPRALALYRGLGYHDAGSVQLRKGVFRCFEKAITSGAGRAASLDGREG